MQYYHCLFYPPLLLRHGLGNVVGFGNIVASSLSLNRKPAARIASLSFPSRRLAVRTTVVTGGSRSTWFYFSRSALTAINIKLQHYQIFTPKIKRYCSTASPPPRARAQEITKPPAKTSPRSPDPPPNPHHAPKRPPPPPRPSPNP